LPVKIERSTLWPPAESSTIPIVRPVQALSEAGAVRYLSKSGRSADLITAILACAVEPAVEPPTKGDVVEAAVVDRGVDDPVDHGFAA